MDLEKFISECTESSLKIARLRKRFEKTEVAIAAIEKKLAKAYIGVN